MPGNIGALFPNDLLILLSKSGSSKELLDLIPYAYAKGAYLIAITSIEGNHQQCQHNITIVDCQPSNLQKRSSIRPASTLTSMPRSLENPPMMPPSSIPTMACAGGSIPQMGYPSPRLSWSDELSRLIPTSLFLLFFLLPSSPSPSMDEMELDDDSFLILSSTRSIPSLPKIWSSMTSFNQMGIHDDLLQRIYAYGFEKPSARSHLLSLCHHLFRPRHHLLPSGSPRRSLSLGEHRRLSPDSLAC